MSDGKSYLRYASCWEDADLLLHALDCPKGADILSIASAGDNSLSLLTTSPRKVTAIDTNPWQLHLLELKVAAFRQLDHTTMLQFLGFRRGLPRQETYHTLRQDLSAAAKDHWDEHMAKIERGVIHTGKFERYLRVFGRQVLPLIHSRKTRHDLTNVKTEPEQAAFFQQRWNTWRWRAFMRLFFSKPVMATFGRDPDYLKQVTVNVSEHALQQTNTHLSSTLATQNPFLDYIVRGNFQEKLPHYARPENFDRICDHLDKLELQLIPFQEISADYDRMNCSNIFEYMSEDDFRAHAQLITEQLRPAGKVAYWNLMVERSLPRINPQKMQSQEVDFPDTGFFYRSFHIDTRIP